MSNPEQNVVTQADREAAADWIAEAKRDGLISRNANNLDHPTARAFARHAAKAVRAQALSNLASLDGETLDLCSGAVIPAGVFDQRPDLGAATPEPTLRTIVYSYYAKHFPSVEAGRLTDRYILALTPTTPTEGQREAIAQLLGDRIEAEFAVSVRASWTNALASELLALTPTASDDRLREALEKIAYGKGRRPSDGMAAKIARTALEGSSREGEA